MIELIPLLFIGVLITWGINCLFSEGFLFDGIGKVMRKTFPEFITKPLFDCPPCCASIWGTVIFFLYSDLNIILWPVYCLCLCGANYIIKEKLYGDH